MRICLMARSQSRINAGTSFLQCGVHIRARTCVRVSRGDRTFVARARSFSLSLFPRALVSYSSEKYKINIVSDPRVDTFLSLGILLPR